MNYTGLDEGLDMNSDSGNFLATKLTLKDTHREKKLHQMRLQPLQKVQIRAFGLLVQQINSI